MKTKSTSDTLCLERCCKSTLPFSLDDPKSADGIGEILIDLCNGRQTGNMKVGLRKPRSIPIICCNFTMGTIQRYGYSVYDFSFSCIAKQLFQKWFDCPCTHMHNLPPLRQTNLQE